VRLGLRRLFERGWRVHGVVGKMGWVGYRRMELGWFVGVGARGCDRGEGMLLLLGTSYIIVGIMEF